MKDRLVIISHYGVAGQRPQTFLLTKHTHTLVVNFQLFCFLCNFSCTHFSLYTLRGHLGEKQTLYSLLHCLFPYVSLSAVCVSLSVHPVFALSLSCTADEWWVARKGLSAVLHKVCVKSLLKATGSAFKYSHLTHPTRGS